MKSTKVLLATAALAFSLGAYSQTDSLRNDSSAHKMDTTKKHSELTEGANTTIQNQQSVSGQQSTTTTSAVTNGTTTTSTTASTYTDQTATPKPNFGRYYIPVLGSYNAVATTADNKSLKITPDENNPGKVWVEGLTETKFYALLKAVPGTYKIPAQKQDDKTIAEGTLIYDESSKQISVCSGCGYNDQAPTATEVAVTEEPAPVATKNKKHQQKVVAKVKKTPVISFTGTKADQGTVSLLQ